MTEIFKLTDSGMRTHGGYQWRLGDWRETDGKGPLCGPGWLHCYSDPLLAVLLNPIHANIASPRLFRGEADGQRLDDHGMKSGFSRMRLVEELTPPTVTTEQRVKFGILCAKAVCNNKPWNKWADGWLDGSDRSEKAAWAASVSGAAWASAAAAAWAWAAASVEAAASAEATASAEAAAAAAWSAHAIDLVAITKQAIA